MNCNSAAPPHPHIVICQLFSVLYHPTFHLTQAYSSPLLLHWFSSPLPLVFILLPSWQLLLLDFPLSLVFASFTSGHTHAWTGWFTLHPGKTTHTYIGHRLYIYDIDPCGVSLTSTMTKGDPTIGSKYLFTPNTAVPVIKKRSGNRLAWSSLKTHTVTHTAQTLYFVYLPA